MRSIALLFALAPGIAYADDPAPTDPPTDPAPPATVTATTETTVQTAIPTGRTFADVLGSAPVATGEQYGVSFSGEAYEGNAYIVDSVVVPNNPWLTYGQLGFVAAQRDIGGSETTHAGLLLGAGILRGKYRLGGELHLGYDRTNEEPVQSGFSGEASLHVRRDAIHKTAKEDDLGGAFMTWVDAGAGAEVLWFGGDRVIRPEASLGIGLGFELFNPDKPGRFGGFSIEFRVVAAPAIEWSDLADRCAGNCSMRLAKPDFSGLLVIGLPFSP